MATNKKLTSIQNQCITNALCTIASEGNPDDLEKVRKALVKQCELLNEATEDVQEFGRPLGCTCMGLDVTHVLAPISCQN